MLLVLWCVACATVEQAPTDPRVVEAEQAFDEARRLSAAGQYAQALPLAERALKLREAVLPKTDPLVAQYLHALGNILVELADYARAEPLLVRALEIREAALGEHHPDVGESVSLLAALYYFQGHYSRAEPLMVRALEIREAALGRSHPDVAVSLNDLATVYMSQGLYARAVPLYVRALEILKAALGENHPDVAVALTNLANLYVIQGLYARAEPLYFRAHKIREAVLGKSHPSVAYSLHGLAVLYMDQGFYARAEPLMARALEIRTAAFGENHPDVATSLDRLGTIYMRQGHYARAELLYSRALGSWEKTVGANHPDTARSLHNLADLYLLQGLYTRAEPLLSRALNIFETTFGENHPSVAASLHNLSHLYRAQGLYARAEPPVERALEIRKATLGENHFEVASSLQSLATLAYLQGHYARAEPLYARALELAKATLGETHPTIAVWLNNLALLRLAQKDTGAALQLLEKAFTISEQHLRQEVFGLSEKNLDSFLGLLRAQEKRVYALARAHPSDARVLRLALSTALLRKCRSVQEAASTALIISHNLGPADRDAFERLRALRTQLASLSLAGPGQRPLADYTERLKQLAAEGDALEADLARRSAPLRALTALPSTADIVDRVAQALPRDGALVELISYEDRPLVPEPGTPESGVPSELRYLALVLFPDSRILALDLGPAGPINSAASRLRDAMANRDAAFQPQARALYRRVFQPLLPLVGKTRHLFLSPDDQLSLVPFAALHDGRQFLVDAFDFTYVTSGKDLLPRPQETISADSVVVFADPDFSAPLPPSPPSSAEAPAPAARSASAERFFSSLHEGEVQRAWTTTPLPGTRREAESIHRLFPQARLILGPDATKERLLHLSTPGILHLATHGFFLDDAPAAPQSRAVGTFGALGEDPLASRPPDPLLRSGLLLAGEVASASSTPPDHALVTALELAGLDLWGTQLVVLSACDTGRGDVKLGQGVYGLRRSFIVAGAETVVMSLWQVKDDTTTQLMEAYYRNLLAGQGRASALREAMRSLRASRPHPHYWAPFIVLGRDAPLRAPAPPR
ncbi:CHAT domain-containing tetratricopeptide repeat protein [Pyxidicoccus caerfyrddinensis]|uniref:CHAT domain-containing tetratricopeptide repeat protein n=1 Tax=Pyxidicoccus caerfyrddinensis TaxID=2709663 RepID=UPI001F07172E|nr:CHAT domain-containing tetratricopeptide repeat protein [Pyxidicoccus caerfyrddinensis]